MIKYIFLSITLIICLFNIAHAQSDIQEAFFQNEQPWGKFIAKPLSQVIKKANVRALCASSVACVKFVVDAEGKITKLSYSKNAPSEVKELLKDLINSTIGNWSLRKVNGNPIESKPFLLILIYSFNTGCADFKAGQDQLISSMRDMLIFDDNADSQHIYDPLDCIILGTIEVGPWVR